MLLLLSMVQSAVQNEHATGARVGGEPAGAVHDGAHADSGESVARHAPQQSGSSTGWDGRGGNRATAVVKPPLVTVV